MKAFTVSMILLVALILCVTANHLYINRVSDDLLERLDALPSIEDKQCVSLSKELSAAWEAEVEYVRLSVGYTVVDRVCEQARTLVACAECGDVYGFQTALALLRDAIGDMRRLEDISISNIL